MRKMHEKIRRERLGMPPLESSERGYLALKNKQRGLPSTEGKYQKVTMEILGRMHYTDFNLGEETEEFHPRDVIVEEEFSDDEILHKFIDPPFKLDPLEQHTPAAHQFTKKQEYSEKVYKLK